VCRCQPAYRRSSIQRCWPFDSWNCSLLGFRWRPTTPLAVGLILPRSLTSVIEAAARLDGGSVLRSRRLATLAAGRVSLFAGDSVVSRFGDSVGDCVSWVTLRLGIGLGIGGG